MTLSRIPEPATEPAGATPACDVALVGGGLANALIALRLLSERPDLSLLVIERGPVLGGNHTWSFHEGDVSPEALRWLEPLITASWPRQCVRFPGHARVLDVPYHAIASSRLNAVLAPALGSRLLTDTDAVELSPGSVTLSDGRVVTARCVIDGRGLERGAALALGYQKFVGLEVETEEPHGEAMPVIMDATVAQIGGYRFVYTLPFTETRILIEDTYYADGPELEAEAIGERVRSFADGKGWRIRSVVRTEEGVLPVVLAGDIDAFWLEAGRGVPRVGLRAALFHPTTGYSLPDAVATAERVASAPDVATAAVQRLVEEHSRACWRDRAFFRLLNRLLFMAAEPHERVRVLERFYRLPGPLIERFFAARLTLADKAQIMAGRPPVPLARALGVLSQLPAWAFARRHSGLPR